MKSVFDKAVREELINRIHSLSPNSQPGWGKMSVYEMAKHCTTWDEWVQGTHSPVYKQEFLGKIFGKMALKSNTKDARPLQKNMPAGKLKVMGSGDAAQQKQQWITRVEGYANYSNPAFIHDFFGKMTQEQIGVFAYKHADHHLRQFGV